ncbi:hypothetical protein [Dyadobacter sp. CY323]|uniref:hypothetical protein n=1 Tax=Dyadobacter sp. CY323 TaxID=2907302 RepID=UPI001F1C35D6|nr:hypothetical protein [Dyadobacter sp. CY323]MCE6993130.1 hypothetical protein [Dyadobacter sp. CY323]
MPHNLPPLSPQDGIYAVLMDIKEVIGRLTQISADTRNDTMDIKAAQKISDTQLNQMTNKLDSLVHDHSELKANVVHIETRTKVLEDREIERKGAMKMIAFLWSAGTALIAWIILNFKTILEFMGFGQ